MRLMISPVPATTVETLMPGFFFSKAAATAFTMSESAAEYTTTVFSGLPCAQAVPRTAASTHATRPTPASHLPVRTMVRLLIDRLRVFLSRG